MTPTSIRTAAALGVLCALLGGCSVGSERTAGAQPSGSTSASTAPSPAATSTLTPEEQQAVEDAAAVVLAREQLFFDLLADPSRSLNEMNSVVTEPQLSIDLADLGQLSSMVADGALAIESSGPIAAKRNNAIQVDLGPERTLVVLETCLDRTQTRVTSEGGPWDSNPELARYVVVIADYLPAPGWAVSRVLPPEGDSQPQPC